MSGARFVRRVALGALLCATTACTTGFAAAPPALSRQVLQQDGWVAYDAAMVADAGAPCCFEFHANAAARGGCSLEGRNWSLGRDDADSTASADTATIYLHVSQSRIDRVRAFAASCPLRDAGGVRRLDAVGAADSIALLAATAAQAGRDEDLLDAATAALALHADAAATAALSRLADSGQPRKLREQALFWSAQLRGAAGAQLVERYARTDADPEFRADAIFDLSQAHGLDAYASIHRIAQADAAEHVREQALFWMAQMGDARARADIVAAIGTESSAAVREQAVFALSQLQEAEAAAALIALVRGNYPRQVKQQALFWLGESGSKEAFEFLDEVLSRQPRHAKDG